MVNNQDDLLQATRLERQEDTPRNFTQATPLNAITHIREALDRFLLSSSISENKHRKYYH